MNRRSPATLLIPLLLLAAGLASLHLAEPLWPDEWYSLLHAQAGGPAAIWASIQSLDPWAPPAYFTLLAGWGALTGWSEPAVRTLSLLLGLIGLSLTYRLGRDLISQRAGLYAAITLGLSAFVLNYLHDLRPYTLLLTLSALTIWLYGRLALTPNPSPDRAFGARRGEQIAFALSVAALLYTHYLSAPLLLALAIYHLIAVPRDRRWWLIPALMAVGLLLFLPWLGVSLSSAGDLARVTGREALAQGPARVLGSLAGFFSNGLPGLLLIAAVAAWKPHERGLVFAWWVFAAGLLIFLGLDLAMGGALLVELRYTLAIWPLLALIAGAGIESLSRRGISPVLILGLWLLGGLWFTLDPAAQERIHLRIWHQPWIALRDSIEGQTREGDVLLYLLEEWPDPPLHVETAGHYLGDLLDPVVIGSDTETSDADYQAAVAKALDGAGRVWLADDATHPQWRREQLESEWLPALGAASCGAFPAEAPLRLSLLVLLPPGDPALDYGEAGIRVFDLGRDEAVQGDSLQTTLAFDQAEDTPPYVYSVSLQLEDSAGSLITQQDYGLPLERFACALNSFDLSGLPPGDYALRLVIYAWESGERLAVTTAEGASDERPLWIQFER